MPDLNTTAREAGLNRANYTILEWTMIYNALDRCYTQGYNMGHKQGRIPEMKYASDDND